MKSVMTDYLMIVLTGLVALAALCQAWFIWKQAQILQASENRTKERDVPIVRMTPLTRSFTQIAINNEITNKSYEGYTVTNAGFVDIEITYFHFEVGWLPSPAPGDSQTAKISFEPVTHHGDATVSTISLPHRLRHGESFHVLFDRDQLVSESAKLGGETPVHMRPYCNDSLGNKHHPHHWISFLKDNRTSFHNEPSPGRITEEELEKLKPSEQRRYAHWTSLHVPPP